MSRLTIALVVMIGLSALVIALACMNTQAVQFNVLTPVPFSAGGLLIVGWVAGLVGGISLYWSNKATEAAQNKTLESWQKQDNKLQAEVQSDKERLLEAKIATLEAALQRALKKN